MKTLTTAALAAIMTSSAVSAERETRCFELRTYYAAPGKLDALNARFRDHTLKLFEKHGMESIGYWMAVENRDNRLVYLLAFPDRAAARQSWKNFGADPAWREIVRKTEAEGRLVVKVESVYLVGTDFSPRVKPVKAEPARIFELRSYTSAPEKLGALQARFRDQTIALFTKHGMINFGYWTPVDSKQGAQNTLIYLLAHKDRQAAAASFETFRRDPDWIKAKAESERNGPLVTKVESVFLQPTDYSPTR